MLKKVVSILSIIILLGLGFGEKAFAYNPWADQIQTDTTNFNNILSASDDDIQKALDSLDEIGDLGDVDTTGIADNKIFQYNSTSGNWEVTDSPTFADLTVNGNVGIGTASPTANLDVKGNLTTALTGTVAVTNASADVVGTTTAFTTELNTGDAIKIKSEIFTVSTITDDTHLALDSNYAGSTESGLTAYKDSNLFYVQDGDAKATLTINKSGNTTLSGDLNVAGTTPPNLILDNTTTGADGHSGWLKMIGNAWFGDVDHERGIAQRLEFSGGAGTYYLKWYQNNLTSELMKLD
ncbi:MAG: hypothetical protein ACTSSP_06625, partial [Candidatus Asgardarchaeia archaeon]